jgi:integral membrane protein
MSTHAFFNSALGWFRFIAITEGISYLLLLFIAMPLKYLAETPEPVTYLGWAHGFLFVLYGLLLLKVWVQYRWTFKKAFVAFIASLVPFGTFVLDKRLKREQLQ